MSMSRSLLAVVLLSSAAFAQTVPTKLSFTARLVDAGAPVQGTRDFIFKLYPLPMGGTEVWSETRNSISVVDGAVNIDLGASTPLTETIFDGQTLYLEVTIGTQLLSPRTPVLSVPYALRSNVADQVGSLTAAQIQQRVATGCGAGAAIQAINANGSVVCAATGGANDAGITTITNITAGAGLTGGGATGNVNLAVNFAGSGAALTAARSDHNHTATYLPLGPTLACTGSDKVVGIAASGSVICAADNNFVYGPLTNGGLTLSGSNQFSLQSCAPNQVLVAGAGGTWSCSTPGGVTSVGGTAPIASSGGASPSLSLATCPTAGHVYKMVGGVWTCSPDSDTAPNGSAPISVSANTVSLAPCPNNNDIYKMNAGSWRCVPDDNSGGTVTGVTGSGVISSSGGTAPVISLSGAVPVANGGTGATSAGAARTSLGAAGSGANSDISSLSGLSTPLSASQGGTGVGAPAAPGQFLKSAAGAWTAAPLAATDLPSGSSNYIQNQSGSAQGASMYINGSVRTNAMIRTGSETGTTEGPRMDATGGYQGLVVRAINSTFATSGQIIARTDVLTFERDGVGNGGGFRVTKALAVAQRGYVMCQGFNTSLTTVNRLVNVGAGAAQGTQFTVFNDTDNMVYFDCNFGTLDQATGNIWHRAHITMSRTDTGAYWAGTLQSTFNQ